MCGSPKQFLGFLSSPKLPLLSISSRKTFVHYKLLLCMPWHRGMGEESFLSRVITRRGSMGITPLQLNSLSLVRLLLLPPWIKGNHATLVWSSYSKARAAREERRKEGFSLWRMMQEEKWLNAPIQPGTDGWAKNGNVSIWGKSAKRVLGITCPYRKEARLLWVFFAFFLHIIIFWPALRKFTLAQPFQRLLSTKFYGYF